MSIKMSGFGARVFMATGAGMCFMVAAICFGGVCAFIFELADSAPDWEWSLLGTLAIVVGIAGGAVTFLYYGLSAIEDALPRGRFAVRPLCYVVVLGMVLVLALVAIPLVPIAFAASMIVRLLGSVLDRVLAGRCGDCVDARGTQADVSDGPVFCPRHERFFGGDMYRALLRDDGD